jgi:ABC-type multidrug transport system ATPase subunit
MSDAVVLLDRFPALAGVDLEVDRGEIVLLRGPNGAGKTTLLRTCAGLARVVQGTVEVLGEDLVAAPRSVRRRVGMLSHQDGLYADLTVADNVRFWARAAGAGLDDARAALARCELDGRLAGVPAARLSAGQRRRTALARCSPAGPSCGCSTSPTPGSTAPGATWSTASCATPPPPGPPCCSPATSSTGPRDWPPASSPSPAA